MAKRTTRRTNHTAPDRGIGLGGVALGVAAFLGSAAALAVAAIAFGRREEGGTPQPLRTDAADGPAPSREQVRDQVAAGDEGHAAPDLAADTAPGGRAPAAFRPDMDAPMSAAEREALRPATGPSPTLVDAGTSQPVN